jgi:hypothetical protein
MWQHWAIVREQNTARYIVRRLECIFTWTLLGEINHRRSPIVAARVLSQVRSRGIISGQSIIGAGFPKYSVHPADSYSTKCSTFTNHLPQTWYNLDTDSAVKKVRKNVNVFNEKYWSKIGIMQALSSIHYILFHIVIFCLKFDTGQTGG